MIFLQWKFKSRKRAGTSQIKQKYVSLIHVSVLVITMLLGMTSICLAQGNTWTTKADMEVPRYQHGTCVVNGKIYAIGGENFGNGCNSPGSQWVEEYDPSTDTWSIKEDMPTERQGLSISAVNGKIYVIGGSPLTCSGELSTVAEYDPQSDTWDTTKTSMQVPRHGLSTSVVNGKIYAIGGYNYSDNIALADVEEYDPITDTWTTKKDMPTARVWLSTCVVDGKIYAFGGHGTVPPYSSLKTVEVYDPVTNTWTTKDDMPTWLQNSPASTVNGFMYLFGGSTSPGGSPRTEVREYNPISDTWLTISQMLSARVAAHSSELNGKIYVIGGSTTNWPFQPTTTVQVYTPPVTGVEDQGENNPAEFALHQNYPNPFNPETIIKYQIPELSLVTLKVYDVLGNKVAILVNEEQVVGSYKVEFDATALPSGIYFYRLQVYPANGGAGNYVETKKMVLLR
jgi:N-acetylneuraminic acid mutarotase